MKRIVISAGLLFGIAVTANAQAGPSESLRGDVAATYHWVHTNAQPAECGCFALNGGGLSGSWNIRPDLAVIADVSSSYSRSAAPFPTSLTLTSFMGGARYYFLHRPSQGVGRVQPFGQVLVGAAHAGGASAGVADGANAFAARVGGGLDLPISKHVVARLLQVDYFLTRFDNSQNQRQNNLLLGAGVAISWSKPR